MSDGIWSAASGAVGQLLSLDVAAQNVANASTPGYKAEHAVFRQTLARASSKTAQTFDLRYAIVGGTAADPTAGTIEPTGRSLDVAVKGDGYLVVRTAAGERYTRFGALRIADDGTLVTRDGHVLVDAERHPIHVPDGAKSVSIAPDGTVVADGATLGELVRVRFDNPRNLVKDGASLLKAQGAKPVTSDVPLEPGALEGSNVGAVKGMIDIVTASRAFEVCEKMIEAFRDADHKAAVEVMAQR